MAPDRSRTGVGNAERIYRIRSLNSGMKGLSVLFGTEMFCNRQYVRLLRIWFL